jgi:solute carrier family 25 (adenine nucleotide translocator) protein 4/5/6/31
MKDVVAKTFQADGICGLYQGYGIALWGSVLCRLLLLGGYDAVKSELQHVKEKRHVFTPMTLADRFLLAQSVALTAGTICYPIDSVRRRLMMQAGQPAEQRKYHGSIHCFRRVFAQEGLTPCFVDDRRRTDSGALSNNAH